MKHPVCLLFILLLSAPFSFAQHVEDALASVDYEFIHVNDPHNPEKHIRNKMRLYLAQHSSHYVNQGLAERMEQIEARLREQGNVLTGNTRIRVTNYGGKSGIEEFYLYPEREKLIMVDYLGTTPYLIGQTFPTLDWKIGDDTREIGGFQAQIAYTSFGGRNYTAWFAPDLPFPFGPWKLHGLPGLILEASDEDDEVQFLFQDFGRLDVGQRKVELPQNGIEASAAQFSRAKEAGPVNPVAIAGATDSGGGNVARQSIVMMKDRQGTSRILTGDEAEAELERINHQEPAANLNPLERAMPEKAEKKTTEMKTMVKKDVQVPDLALFQAVYDFTYVEDTTMREQPLNEEMMLYVNHHASLYRRSTDEESEFHRFLQLGGKETDFDLNSILEITASLYQNQAKGQRVLTERLLSEMYQITEPMGEIEWSVRDQTKEIEGYQVQLAVGHYAGREYEAWFAAEIPFPFGPWKLHGLPGLILEAKDSRNDIIFTFRSFTPIEDKNVIITVPTEIRQITQSAYDRMYQGFRDNPAAFIRSSSAGSASIRIGASTRVGGNTRQRGFNNPMELH